MSIIPNIVKIPFATLPGWRQYYDIFFYAGWKIQKHEYKDSFRLISPKGKKWVKDTEAECRAIIEQRKDKGLSPRNKHLIIVVPGLNGMRFTFSAMENTLKEEGFEVLYWEFGSNHCNTERHAHRLLNLIHRLDGIEKISFVAHSLGGLILRTMLHEENNWHTRFELGHIVNIASPHGGSFVADLVRDNLKLIGLYEWVCGHVGTDLTSVGAKDLPPLTIPVGMIIGGSGNSIGFNPLAKQDNDFVVSMESTQLDLCVDHIQVKGSHTVMLSKKETIQQTLYFLEHGKFNHGS